MAGIAVSGGGGLVGRAVVEALGAAGHTVRTLVRRAARAPHEIAWDPAAGTADAAGLEGLDAIIHLAGEPIAQRWTPAAKAAIRDSRVAGTATLARALAGLVRPPATWLCASAVGFYGDTGDAWVDESSPPGAGFLAEVCQAWEAAARPAVDAGMRVVHLRLGVVLGAGGGALARLLPPFRAGLGGPVGGGRQYLAWVAKDDVVGATLHALATPALVGPVNVTAPTPVTSRDFARTLGRVLHRPAIVPAPAFALRLMFGEMADEALLVGQRVRPARLLASGFRFALEDLEPALRHAVGR